MSQATIRGIPPGGIRRQRVKVADDDSTLVWCDAADDEWDDVIIPGTLIRTRGVGALTAPDLKEFGPDSVTFQFAFTGVGVQLKQAYFAFEMPHSWKEGTLVRPHIHWAPANANAGNVKWILDVTAADAGLAFPNVTNLVAICAAGGVAWAHQINEFPTLALPNKKIGTIVCCRLGRDPTDAQDTYASDAFLLSFGVHFQMDTHGSRGVFTK